jgi:hypothetical protein
MTEDRLYADPELARFYDHDNRWGPEDAYVRALAQVRARVRDLGRGTGRCSTSRAQNPAAQR